MNKGAPFDLRNTGDAAIIVAITTECGSVVRLTLPPGGDISVNPVCENLELKADGAGENPFPPQS